MNAKDIDKKIIDFYISTTESSKNKDVCYLQLTHKVRDACRDKQLMVLKMPISSSALNPVESVWSWVKHQFRKASLGMDHKNSTVDTLGQTLNEICQSIPAEIIQGFQRASMRHMHDVLTFGEVSLPKTLPQPRN